MKHICNKKDYRTLMHAARAAESMYRNGVAHGQLRIYICPQCGTLHITSKPFRTIEERREYKKSLIPHKKTKYKNYANR